jgi:hypothetical protein
VCKKNRGFQPQFGNDEKVSSYSKIFKRRNINYGSYLKIKLMELIPKKG